MKTERVNGSPKEDVASEFVCTWRLISHSAVTLSGEITYPMGLNARGSITYEASGRMTVQLADPDRAVFAAGDRRAGTDAEVGAAFDSYPAHHGT